jgi:hypothetical protein
MGEDHHRLHSLTLTASEATRRDTHKDSAATVHRTLRQATWLLAPTQPQIQRSLAAALHESERVGAAECGAKGPATDEPDERHTKQEPMVSTEDDAVSCNSASGASCRLRAAKLVAAALGARPSPYYSYSYSSNSPTLLRP